MTNESDSVHAGSLWQRLPQSALLSGSGSKHRTALLRVALLISVAVLSSCSASSHQERRWTEEVRLEDGSTVQIERYVEFDSTNAMGGGAYNGTCQ